MFNRILKTAASAAVLAALILPGAAQAATTGTADRQHHRTGARNDHRLERNGYLRCDQHDLDDGTLHEFCGDRR